MKPSSLLLRGGSLASILKYKSRLIGYLRPDPSDVPAMERPTGNVIDIPGGQSVIIGLQKVSHINGF